MAIGGDILIKLGADVAELRKGFDDAKKSLTGFQDQITSVVGTVAKFAAAIGVGELVSRLASYGQQLQKNAADLQTQAQTLGLTTDQFQAYKAAALDSGQSVDVITTAITKFNVAIGQAEQGSKLQVDALNELGVKILDSNGNLRSQGDLLTEVSQKLLKLPEGARRAAAEIVFFGKSGQSLNPILAKLAEDSETLIQKYTRLGLVINQETVTALDEMQRKSDVASQKIDVLFSKVFAEAKGSLVGKLAGDMQELATALRAASAFEGILDKISAFFQAGSFGASIKGSTDVEIWRKSLDETNTSLAEMQQRQARVTAEFGAASLPVKQLQKEIDAAGEKARKLEDAIAGGTLPDVAVTATKPTGSLNPTIKSTRGATPRDRVAEMLAELALRQTAEEKALATLRGAAIDTPLRELEAQVNLQKKIDDTIASVASKQKGGATPDLIKRVTDQVTSTETAAAATKKYTESLQLAFATQKTFGDGQVEHRETMSKLSDALSTGRVKVEAYKEAVKQANLTQEEQGRIARGQIEGIDAVAAGWESAAAKYEKSNNSFAQGGQLFDGVVGLMSDSIIGFATNADFSFNKVLLSFANLLAQMAIRAAASQFFKLAGGLFGGGGGGSAFANVGDLIGSLGLGGAAAIGGAVRHGVGYSVGENGPETFIPRVDGRIMTASDMADQWGGGGNPVYQTINLSTGIVQTVRAELASMLPSIAQAGASAAESSRRRGGRYKQTFSR